MYVFAWVLGILAGCVQLLGYYQYNRAMTLHPEHKPNAASWAMWGLGGAAELIVFAALTTDHSKEILPAVCSIVVIFTFIRVWRRGESFEVQDWWNVGTVTFDVVVVAYWFITKNPYIANALLGLDMIASFLPILRSVWNDPSTELPTPWRTWTTAYSLLTLLVIIQWESGWELIYPVTYMVLHGAVWLLSSRKAQPTAAV